MVEVVRVQRLASRRRGRVDFRFLAQKMSESLGGAQQTFDVGERASAL